jgi:hypothetical protein
VNKKLLQAARPCSLVRSGNEVRQVLAARDAPGLEEQSVLCAVEQGPQEFTVAACAEPIWLVARTMRTAFGPGFVLAEGTVLKLGRVCFRVTMLRTACEETASDNTQDSEDLEFEVPNERENGICRICLSSESETSNPLISPCRCDGSMKFIHLMCLRQWMQARMVARNTERCVTFSWKSIDCEICKASLPFAVEEAGKETELLRIDKPKGPFLVLEGVGNDKNSNKGVHVISVTGNNCITLGRGHDADVRISDISVSRCHASIRFVDGCFVIEDNNSKFGTLVKATENLVVKAMSTVVVQIGRTVVSFSTKPQNEGYEGTN